MKHIRDIRIVTVLCVSLLTTASACSTVQTLTDAALGRPGREERAAEQSQRAERAQGLSDAQIEHRLAYLTEKLDDNKLHAVAWQYGWMFIDAAGSLSSAGLAATSSDHFANNVMHAVKGAIGVFYLAINPVHGLSGADPIREMPSATHSDKVAQLVAAENELAEAADHSMQRYSWAYHIGNLVFNAAASGAVAATGDHSRGLQSFLVDTTAGEIQVWTQPWEPPSQWEEYERMVAAEEGTAYTPRLTWQFVTSGSMIGVRARF